LIGSTHKRQTGEIGDYELKCCIVGEDWKIAVTRKEVSKETPQYGRDVFASLKARISCHYTPHYKSYDLTIKSTPGFFPLITV